MKFVSRVVIVISLLFAGLAVIAQTQTKTDSSTNLPNETTVNEFLKHMFGWNDNLAWRVVSIKPSEAPSISEVTVVFNTPDGQAVQRIYVTPDEHYAFSGELVPFGADPFAATRGRVEER